MEVSDQMPTIPFVKEEGEEKYRLRFQNKNRMSLIANILEVASQPVGRTHLMYKANLSHRMLTSYLVFLLEQGLIAEKKTQNGKVTFFQTSESGRKYLETYKSLLELARGLSGFTPFPIRP